ncbi:MAG: TonB family protein [Zoogloeaceae bacterium]|jgi:protein TonB|nr:TonB family protein [Zoogloeaceae bacterium]
MEANRYVAMRRGSKNTALWLCVALAHAGVLWLLARSMTLSVPKWQPPVTLAVMFSAAEATTAEPAPAPPSAPEAEPEPPSQPRVKTRPVLAAPPRVEDAPAPAEEVAQPAPVEVPFESAAPVTSAAAAEATGTGTAAAGVSAGEAGGTTELPRFDADYLDNPKPNYPAFSRQLGESGQVLLRVFVEANGRASRVEIKKSSGFARLDKAAQEVVYRWRFIPARRVENGTQHAVSAWVVVPITFKLE